jgi:hypothetical protein
VQWFRTTWEIRRAKLIAAIARVLNAGVEYRGSSETIYRKFSSGQKRAESANVVGQSAGTAKERHGAGEQFTVARVYRAVNGIAPLIVLSLHLPIPFGQPDDDGIDWTPSLPSCHRVGVAYLKRLFGSVRGYRSSLLLHV